MGLAIAIHILPFAIATPLTGFLAVSCVLLTVSLIVNGKCFHEDWYPGRNTLMKELKSTAAALTGPLCPLIQEFGKIPRLKKKIERKSREIAELQTKIIKSIGDNYTENYYEYHAQINRKIKELTNSLNAAEEQQDIQQINTEKTNYERANRQLDAAKAFYDTAVAKAKAI